MAYYTIQLELQCGASESRQPAPSTERRWHYTYAYVCSIWVGQVWSNHVRAVSISRAQSIASSLAPTDAACSLSCSTSAPSCTEDGRSCCCCGWVAMAGWACTTGICINCCVSALSACITPGGILI